MESFASFHNIIKVLTEFGLVGVVLLMWWYDNRLMRRLHEEHKEEITLILKRYQQDMAEQRQMYRDNVELVRNYDSINRDLKDIVVMNTQAMTKICHAVEKNQFCPVVRRKQGDP